MSESGYCFNCGYGYLGVPGDHRPTCPSYRYDGRPHQWSDSLGAPWIPGSKGYLCAVCGKTPDAHPAEAAPGASATA